MGTVQGQVIGLTGSEKPTTLQFKLGKEQLPPTYTTKVQADGTFSRYIPASGSYYLRVLSVRKWASSPRPLKVTRTPKIGIQVRGPW